MSRRKRAIASRTRKRDELAPKLLGLGLLLALLPVFLGKSPLASGLRPLMPLGWLLVAVAVGMLLWGRRASAPTSSPAIETAAVPRGKGVEPFVPAGDAVAKEWVRPNASAETIDHDERARPTAWNAEVLERIEWRRFEAVVEALFAQAGFDTKSQSHGADEGIDIWLFSRSNPGEPVSLVQCKHWQGKRVGVDKVRELRGVMAAKNVARGQFATTSTFTDEAIAFAKANGINLLDVRSLLDLVATRSDEQRRALLDVALEGDYWRPTCVNCGIKMVERSSRKGGPPFWGCSRYPRCKTTLPMRGSVATA